ncbi:MAG: sugar transferase [Desulfobacteraceae bacterium]|nr:sugar transferase [Desulfobacteraceae bacterium]
MKRFFDITAAVAGLLVLLPLLIVAGALIKADGGPVFFRQARVGCRGVVFYIFKFRSMVPDAEKLGSLVTAQYDPRITRIGRFLRSTKLDELPQLLNVIRGDISLVGPRPEVPYYVEMWPEDARREILSVRPGITDYATLFYNDEQAVLAETDDPELSYVEEILPHKLAMYKKYVRERSFWLDFRILVATLLKMAGAEPDRLVPEMRCSSR